MENVDAAELKRDFLESVESYESFKTNKIFVNDIISKDNLTILDKLILSSVIKDWRKVARVVGGVITDLEKLDKLEMFGEHQNNSDILINQRIMHLLENNNFVAQGDVRAMRFSEIKIK